MPVSMSEKTRFCGNCGGIAFRYRVLHLDKSCIILKLSVNCSKAGCDSRESVEIKIPLEEKITQAA